MQGEALGCLAKSIKIIISRIIPYFNGALNPIESLVRLSLQLKAFSETKVEKTLPVLVTTAVV